VPSGMPPMLTVLQTNRFLVLTRPGRLLPWLGPALRGLVAGRFKEQVCRHSPAEQRTRWRYCKGCPHLTACPYGLTLEAGPPPGAVPFRGQEDAARPVVLAPAFPTPGRADIGLEIPVGATFVGPAAARQAGLFWEAAAAAGADPHA